MNKPITLIREEFKSKLANDINNSGLPAFIIEPILHDFLNEIRILCQRQYEMDKEEYEKETENDNIKTSKKAKEK